MIMMILILLPLIAACAGYLICRSGGSGRYYYVLLGSTVLEFAAAVFAALGGSAALNIPLICGLGISLKLDGAGRLPRRLRADPLLHVDDGRRPLQAVL